jgi:hypothetical protein
MASTCISLLVRQNENLVERIKLTFQVVTQTEIEFVLFDKREKGKKSIEKEILLKLVYSFILSFDFNKNMNYVKLD